jgi:hypothetical protein
MNSTELLVGLAAASTLLSLWAAVFATRAYRASRRAAKVADLRWESVTKPLPNLTFQGAAAAGKPIDVTVENLGGTIAAGGVIVQSGDDLYAGELVLPEKAAARSVSLDPVMKAWQRAGQPRTLLLVVRDVGGRCWDCLDGGKPIHDSRKWLAGQLRELRLQGVVDFPGVTGSAKR